MHIRTSRYAAYFIGVLFAVAGCSSDDAATQSAGGGGVSVTVSGEEFATDGFLFPTGSEATLVDGWELELSHMLVVVDHLTLAATPDISPTDQSVTGPVVARADGPWAIDLHVEGSVPGAGGEGTATPITAFERQTENGGKPFEADQRYAFGYELVPGTASAARVNFAGDAETETLFDEMVASGYNVLYVGTATFKGTDCSSSDPNYDFSKIPTSIPFKFGFKTPVKNINCQNQENQGDAFAGEEYQRGVPIRSNAASVAQITIHADHPFFSDVEHEPALYFDQFAARMVGQPSGVVLSLASVESVDPTAFVDGAGGALPWRVCDGSQVPLSAQRGFEVGSVPVNPAADPANALRGYADFVRYVQSTQGHLNGGEGLCFVQRNYPSPP